MPLLDHIYIEMNGLPDDGPVSDLVFRLVDELILEMGEEGIADKIVDATALAVPWIQTANILGIMIWSTSDNGGGIMRSVENWLADADDERRAFIGLHLDVYPFNDPGQMEKVLKRVSAIHSSLAKDCDRMISSRRNLGERKT